MGKSVGLIQDGCPPHAWKRRVAAHGLCFTGTRRDLKENTGMSLSLELLSNVALPLCPMCNNVSNKSFKMAEHKICGKWPC